MSRQLVESIIDKEFVLAEAQFNDRLSAIMEKKLYEKKRQVAADMDEAFGGLTRAEIEDRKKKGYVKASHVLSDPRDIKIPMKKKKEKKIKEAVEVLPDPEARVRGGKAKPVKGTFRRKAGAAAIKAVRRTSRAIADYVKPKIDQTTQTQDDDWSKAAGAEPSHPKTTDTKPITSREKFVNALKGREIDYRPEKITDPNKKPGVAGFLGKVARGALKGAESGLHSMEE